jgi:outer membrane protein TolC
MHVLPEGPLELAQAVDIALANNPELTAGGHEIDAVQAQRDAAVGQLFPTLRAAGGYNRYLDDQRVLAASENGEMGVFSRGIFSADLVVSMPLFTGGRIVSEIRGAELLRKAAEHRLARSREELVFNVSSTFYGILASRRVVESLEFSQKALEEHLKRVNELVAAQKAARVDRLRIEVRLADIRQKALQARNVQAIQTRILANLMGLEGAPPDLALGGELTLQEDAPAVSVESALAGAMRQRSDYLAARAVLEAQAKAVDAARAGRWPTLSLQGAYGGRWAEDPSGQPPGTDSSGDVGRVGLGLEFPLFEGGRIAARVREQRAKLAAAQERLRKLELQIRLDVETAALNAVSSRERVLATEKAVEQAGESLRIEREKYELGKGAVVDVLDAQSALLDLQTNYYRALADRNVARAQLELAVGGQ